MMMHRLVVGQTSSHILSMILHTSADRMVLTTGSSTNSAFASTAFACSKAVSGIIIIARCRYFHWPDWIALSSGLCKCQHSLPLP